MRSRFSRFLTSRFLPYALASLWLVVVLYPIVFLVQNSMKSQPQYYNGTFWQLPKPFSIANYVTVWNNDFVRFFFNSFLSVGVSLVILLFAGSLAAYGLSRIRFRFRTLFYFIFVGGLTIPIHITLIPVYELTRSLGIYDRLIALIGPFVAFNLPVTVFIVAAFMGEISQSLEEAAYMDGAGRWQIYARIITPISRPALTAVGILDAVVLWNQFIFPLVLISSVEKRPIPLALWNFQGQFSANIPLMMAALVLASLPLFIVYAIVRERLIEGMVAGAIKG